MPYSVELNFDVTAERRVRALWGEVAAAGLCTLMPDMGARPHLSLAVFEQVPVTEMSAALDRLARQTTCLLVELKAVGVFPGRENAVYLAPAVTPELLRVHREFYRIIEPLQLEPWSYYLPGQWMPHCTIALDIPDAHIGPVVELCRTGGALGSAEITDVTLVEFRPVRTITLHSLAPRPAPDRA